jgi:tight adherence protein C
MLTLSPASKIILIGVACLAVVALLVRLFLKWRANRAIPTPPVRRPSASPPPSHTIADAAPARRPAGPASLYDLPDEDSAAKPVPVETQPVAATSPFASPAPVARPVAVKTDFEPVAAAAPTSRRSAQADDIFSIGGARSFDTKSAPSAYDFEELPDADGSDYRFGSVTPVLAAMLPESEDRRRKVMKQLRNAGEYGRHAWHNFAAVRYLGLVLPILFFGVGLLLVPESLEPLMIIGMVVGPILGWSLPTISMQSRAQARVAEVAQGVPDMLDILNMCVSQGMTVQSALSRVARDLDDVYPALSKELKIVTAQSRVGSLHQALEGFSERCDTPEVHSFTSLLVQTEKMGTSMSEALTEYSDNMRESVKQRSDEKANSATFKLLFPTVLCLMPAVFLLLLGPAILELSNFVNNGGRDILNTGSRQAVRSAQQ